MAATDINLIFEKYKQVNEALGLGPMVGGEVNVPGPGSQSAGAKVVFALVKPKHNHSECEEGKNGCTCGGCPKCRKNAEDAENLQNQKTNVAVYIVMKKFIFKLVMILKDQIAVAVKHHA